MRRHVDEVAGRAVGQLRQLVRRRHAELRLGLLDRVDDEVGGADVVGITLQHPRERVDELLGSSLGLAFRRPVVPGHGVHHRLGEERGGVVVVGPAQRDAAHGGGVGLVERRAIGGRVGAVALRERLDQRLLALVRLGGELECFVHRLADLGLGRGIVAGVDVRSERVGDAPVAHRALRIELGGVAERRRRFAVVEAEGEGHALVEEALRLLRRGGDRTVVEAEVVHQVRAVVVAAIGEHRCAGYSQKQDRKRGGDECFGHDRSPVARRLPRAVTPGGSR